MMDDAWLEAMLRECVPPALDSPEAGRLWSLLIERAVGFAAARDDVLTANLLPPRRGLGRDESASFLRAVDEGFAVVDSAGYVTLPLVQQKKPVGRYALFSKSGAGVSVNLEYVVQVGATAELVIDHGWPPDRVGFERGVFDAVAYDQDGRVALAMEAKARPTGPDSLEKLVRSWVSFAADPTADLANNAGRKWQELDRLAGDGPVVVWLVADQARWSLTARVWGSGASARARCDSEWPAAAWCADMTPHDLADLLASRGVDERLRSLLVQIARSRNVDPATTETNQLLLSVEPDGTAAVNVLKATIATSTQARGCTASPAAAQPPGGGAKSDHLGRHRSRRVRRLV